MKNPFVPQILETASSKFSGEIRAIKSFGDTYISTGFLTQSGGLVRDVWKPVLKTLSKTYHLKPKTCLILGLAGGTVAGMIKKSFPDAQITGVEIDPVMIDLGKKYLGLDKIPDLKIVVADAKSYLISLPAGRQVINFDLILVDLYLGDQLPEFVYSPEFLRKLGQLGQFVIINHLYYDDVKKQNAEKLIGLLKPLFPQIRLHRVLTNLMIIVSK